MHQNGNGKRVKSPLQTKNMVDVCVRQQNIFDTKLIGFDEIMQSFGLGFGHISGVYKKSLLFIVINDVCILRKWIKCKGFYVQHSF